MTTHKDTHPASPSEPPPVPATAAKDKAGKPMDDGDKGGGKTVDDPPGKQGYQAQTPGIEPPPVPDWKPGENPPGTNPPKPAAKDPATTLPPGTNPVFDEGETKASDEKPAHDKTQASHQPPKAHAP